MATSLTFIAAPVVAGEPGHELLQFGRRQPRTVIGKPESPLAPKRGCQSPMMGDLHITAFPQHPTKTQVRRVRLCHSPLLSAMPNRSAHRPRMVPMDNTCATTALQSGPGREGNESGKVR